MPRGEMALVTVCCAGCCAIQPEVTPEPWELSPNTLHHTQPHSQCADPNTLHHTQPHSQCAAREQGAGTSKLQGDHLLIPAQCAASMAAVIPCILWDSRPDVQGALSIPENPAANGRKREK